MWFAVATAELLTVAAVGPVAPTSACKEDLTIQGMECARPNLWITMRMPACFCQYAEYPEGNSLLRALLYDFKTFPKQKNV